MTMFLCNYCKQEKDADINACSEDPRDDEGCICQECNNELYYKPEWHKNLKEELGKIFTHYSDLYCLPPSDLLEFMCEMIAGKFVLYDYSEELAKKALDGILDNLKEARKNLGQDETRKDKIFRISPEVHKIAKIEAAKKQVSLQTWIENLIKNDRSELKK